MQPIFQSQLRLTQLCLFILAVGLYMDYGLPPALTRRSIYHPLYWWRLLSTAFVSLADWLDILLICWWVAPQRISEVGS